ncbi:MAG: C40 family peptidase [Chitinispirillaceae bacterium]|nr:C40 family peptidase [Chitinispirillaceae bacterium]
MTGMLTPRFSISIAALCAGCILAGCISSSVRFTAPEEGKKKRPGTAMEKRETRKAIDDGDFGALLDDPVQKSGEALLEKAAVAWLGTPYRYGGMSKAGIDCSGLVCMIYREAVDYTLPRSSEKMQQLGSPVQLSALRKGDLLFFRNGRKRVDHVAMYLDNDRFVHASSKLGVIISSMNDDYYRSRCIEARRIVP